MQNNTKNIPELSFFNSTPEYFETLIKDKDFVYHIMEEILKTLSVYLLKKRIPNRIKLFKVKFENTFLIIQKEDYKDLVNNILSFYEKKEEYQKCEICKKILNNL
jgi:hypothetical protein